MKKIISASRRTDVPAFYGDWFMARLAEAFAGVVNPFGGQKYIVSLRPEDVVCFVFWSKNFATFIENLKAIENMGYRFYFNYTVTGLPEIFESNVDKKAAVNALKTLSTTYSPEHINWRYDKIIISSISDYDYYVEIFKSIASRLAGFVRRCYFSYVVEYAKVRRNFQEFQNTHSLQILEADNKLKIDLAKELAEIACEYGIEMFSCCGDYLVCSKTKKAHCIDGAIIKRLFYPNGLQYSQKPTRDECGCTESTDIGAYDTCPHGCIYCYANANKQKARQAFINHDADSAFPALAKSESDKYIAEINSGYFALGD
jgi:hypothetical protein